MYMLIEIDNDIGICTELPIQNLKTKSERSVIITVVGIHSNHNFSNLLIILFIHSVSFLMYASAKADQNGVNIIIAIMDKTL